MTVLIRVDGSISMGLRIPAGRTALDREILDGTANRQGAATIQVSTTDLSLPIHPDFSITDEPPRRRGLREIIAMPFPTTPRLAQPSPLMVELDRLGWNGGVSFACHGVRVGIRMDDPSRWKRVVHHLPPGWMPTASPEVDFLYSLRTGGDRDGGPPASPVHHSLHVGATLLVRTMDLDDLFHRLGSAMEVTVSLGARRELFVHAGVVGWHGRAIVIPGRSESGKTTSILSAPIFAISRPRGP